MEDYDIIKNVIGKGGFGVVRKVKSKFTQEVRVAKIKNMMRNVIFGRLESPFINSSAEKHLSLDRMINKFSDKFSEGN